LVLVSPGPSAYAAFGKTVSVKVTAPKGAPIAISRISPLANALQGGIDVRSTSLRTGLNTIGRRQIPAAIKASAESPSSAETLALPAASPDASQADISPISLAAPAAEAAGAPAPESPEAALMSRAEAIPAQPGRVAASVSRIRASVSSTLKSIFSSRQDAGAMPVAAASAQTGPNGRSLEKASPALKPGISSDSAGQAEAETSQPPAPENPETTPAKKSFGWFGLGSTVALFLGALLTQQVGLEAQGAAMAQLTEETFGDYSILAQVAIFSQLGMMLGQQLAQAVIAKLGLTKTFYAAHFLRALSIGTMIFLIGTGALPLPMMYVFYAANGIMTGIATTALLTLRKILIGSGEGRQEKFLVIYQFSAEIIGVIAPILFGSLIGFVGAGAITAIFPAAIVASLLLLIAKKVLPSDAAQQAGGPSGFAATAASFIASGIAAIRRLLPTIRAGVSQARTSGPGLKDSISASALAVKRAVAHPLAALKRLKTWFLNSSIYQGFKIVWHTPVLKYSFLGAASFDMLNVFLYRLFAPGFGKMIGGASGMSAISGMICGLYSAGGLITAVVLLALQNRMKRKSASVTTAASQEPQASSEDMQRRSVLRWTMMGVPAVLLLATLALQLPTLGAVVALPKILAWAGALTLPAIAMIPFGFFQVAASVKLNSFFIDNLPDPQQDPANKDKVQKAVAFSGSAFTALTILGMLAMRPMFSHLETFNPFNWIAIATVFLALAIFFIQRKLASAIAPDQAGTKTDPKK